MAKRSDVAAVCMKCRKRIIVHLLPSETLAMRSCVDFSCPGKLAAVGVERIRRRARQDDTQTTLFNLKGK